MAISDSLVAYWKFDTASPGLDSSGKGHTLSLTSGNLSTGKYNQSLSAYVQSPYTTDLDFSTGAMSMSFWLKRSGGQNGILGSGNFGSSIYAYTTDGNTITIAFNHTTGLNWNYTPGNTNWHHFVVVRDTSTSLRLYIDGSLFGSPLTISSGATISLNKNGTSGYWLNYYDGYANSWAGFIDDFAVWKGYALISSEVSGIYSANTDLGTYIASLTPSGPTGPIFSTSTKSLNATLVPSIITAITKVSNDSTFNTVSNWRECKLVYKSGSVIKEVFFNNVGGAVFPDSNLVFPSGTWTLIAIHLYDSNGNALLVNSTDIPTGNSVVIS